MYMSCLRRRRAWLCWAPTDCLSKDKQVTWYWFIMHTKASLIWLVLLEDGKLWYSNSNKVEGEVRLCDFKRSITEFRNLCLHQFTIYYIPTLSHSIVNYFCINEISCSNTIIYLPLWECDFPPLFNPREVRTVWSSSFPERIHVKYQILRINLSCERNILPHRNPIGMLDNRLICISNKVKRTEKGSILICWHGCLSCLARS